MKAIFPGHEDTFRRRGFSVRPYAKYLRLVKDHCEVHILESPSGYLLEIPVVRAYPGEAFPERVTKYLEERNASPKGPGTFVVRGDTIWCVCEVAGGEETGEADSVAETAHRVAEAASCLVQQVELLGPKILNLR
ncbi:MAG TPA: hypothetical protein GX512_05770 [Firmicutes bacterium]|nr:hypothetical protein [Candidatus Fermentithermobacillaceae bacterium]